MPRQSLKQRPDGRYTCKYKGKCFYGYTQSEALAERENYKRMIEQGLRVETADMTFTAYAAKWLSAYKADVSTSTYNAYAHYLDNAGEIIGNLHMREITATDIKTVYNAQLGKSASHIKKYCATLTSLFESAVEDGASMRNPCAKTQRPIGESGSHRALEKWERSLVIQMADKHDFGLAAMLMLYGGLRRGEALAFDIDRDVDYNAGVIHVRGAVNFSGGNQPTMGNTKTQSGIRTLPLFDPLRKALQGHHGLVASRQNGEVMSQSAIKRKWESYIAALETEVNGCPKRWYGKKKEHIAILSRGEELPPWKEVSIRTHDLRHTFCTMLYDAGVDVKTAMKWMGHADESMILKVYAHLSQEKEKAAELSMAKMINESLK